MTMFVAILAFLYLPAPPTEGGKSILGHIVMSRRDADVLSARVLADDPKKAFDKNARVSVADIKDTVSDWRLYGHCASAILSSYVVPLLLHCHTADSASASSSPPSTRTARQSSSSSATLATQP